MLTEIEMRDIAIKHALPMVPKGRDYPWAYIDKVIAFARAIEQASRRTALEEAWEAVHGERLEDPSKNHGDVAYDIAVADCEHAIRALTNEDAARTGDSDAEAEPK
jgi:hypothetical protein